jgi:Family of unknown function (DUF6516)
MAKSTINQAVRIFYEKAVLPDGGIVEMVIWRVPEPVPPTTHGLKYRLFYGKDGERIVGYDNERGKGDHRHFKGHETAYRFVSPEKLVADFLADVDQARGEA